MKKMINRLKAFVQYIRIILKGKKITQESCVCKC